MTTPLERAIEALSDPNVSLSDALRLVLIVAKRVKSDELTGWVSGELNGYRDSQATLPGYRTTESLPIKLHFDGPRGSSYTRSISSTEVPDNLDPLSEGRGFYEPVAELQAICDRADDDASFPMPVSWVQLYRQHPQSPKVSMMQLNGARVLIPKHYLLGILDRIKSNALDLLLELEEVDLSIGSPGGVSAENNGDVRRVIHTHLTQNIYGGNVTNVQGDNAVTATGDGAIAIQISTGDHEALLQQVRELLTEEAASDLAKALDEDGESEGPATRKWLQKVKNGGYTLAGGMTVNAAYDGAVELLKLYFGG